jgi:hypothetical protein
LYFDLYNSQRYVRIVLNLLFNLKFKESIVKDSIYSAVFLLCIGFGLYACEDPTMADSKQTCETLTCLSNESCQEDSQGNAYCLPLAGGTSDVPLQNNGSNAGQDNPMNEDMNGTWTSDTPDQNSTTTSDQAINPSRDMGTMNSDQSTSRRDFSMNVTDCQDLRINLKPDLRSSSRVVLVVDRSSSMLQDEDRWTPMQEAIELVTSSLQDQIEFGLVFFPNPIQGANRDESIIQSCMSSGRTALDCEDGYEACLPSEMWIEPAFNNAEAIRNAMMQWRPPSIGLGTPTYSGLSAAG